MKLGTTLIALNLHPNQLLNFYPTVATRPETKKTIMVIMQWSSNVIMISRPCGLHPITPHFYIVKLGFTGVYFFSHFRPETKIMGTSSMF